MLFPFVHHQLRGETCWFIVPHCELPKLYLLAAEMYGVLYGVTADSAAKVRECKIMGRALLYSKQLFPPLSLLKANKITFHTITLRAGQVLTASGGDAHFGFSTVSGRTVAVATNVATSAWLKEGLPFVLAHFKWIREELEVWWQTEGQTLEVAKNSPAALRDLLSHDAMVDKCIVLCPPNFACSFIRGINADLAALEKGCDPVCQYRKEDVQADIVDQHRAQCREILQWIHKCRPFTTKMSAASCPSCSSSKQTAEHCLCMQCRCGSAEMDEPWLDAELVPILTLQPTNPSWHQASIAASDVNLLPVVCRDDLSTTLTLNHVAHAVGAVSADLIDEIAHQAIPWLNKLCDGKKNGTGVTVEVTRDSVREVETGTDLDPKDTPLGDLLDRLLADPQLLQLARQVAGPGAAIFPEVYLRIRHPDHYTRLHSDHSFFAQRNLLEAEPIGTVWIPLQACEPATGALLLLPETNALKQSDADVSPAFEVERWKKLGAAGGYAVSSANMQAGSALLFSPTVVHGGALRGGADSVARCSIDLRILAKPLFADPRVALVSIVGRELLRSERERLKLATPKVKEVGVTKSEIQNLLNNTYIFAIILREHPSMRQLLGDFIDAARDGLRPHYVACMLPAANALLDAQQRVQYRTIWPDPEPENSDRSRTRATDLSDSEAFLRSAHREGNCSVYLSPSIAFGRSQEASG